MKSLIFTGEMVRALLDGRKTQTRRVVKPQPIERRPGDGVLRWNNGRSFGSASGMAAFAPLQPGETIFVKETWAPIPGMPATPDNIMFREGTTGDRWRWRSPLHLRSEHARIFLRIESVRVERLQDITEEDAKAEGVPKALRPPQADQWERDGAVLLPYLTEFRGVWEDIHGENAWDANPWVWVYSFRRVEK